IEAGVPWFDVRAVDGRHFRCAVKSGCFGKPDSLLRLFLWNRAA
ncbi:four-carbon acid sugar kinase family protein, partial [Rhizobium ruizarguesonis]